MAFSQYQLCDLPGSASNAVRLVNQELSDIINSIDTSVDLAQPSFTEADTALTDLLSSINDLLVTADASELRGIVRFNKTLGLPTSQSTLEEDERRLSLIGFSLINGKALLQCTGNNVDEVRRLIKIVGLEEAEKIITSAVPNEKIVLITKSYQIEVNTGSNVAPSIDYINSTYNLNITESDVVYVSEGNVVDLTQTVTIKTAQPIIAVVSLEEYIGKDISLQAAADIAGVPVEQLNITVFSFCGKSTTSNGRALFTTVGFNANNINSEHYNLKIKENNSDIYEIDITGNAGASGFYNLETIASTINWQLPNVEVYSLNNELVFRTTKVGVTAAIEFFDSSENDAASTCGVINGIQTLIDESATIKRENVKIDTTKSTISYTSNHTGAKATVSSTTPQKISDLPSVILRGGNNTNTCSILTRKDIAKFKMLGFTNEQISIINECVTLADVSPSTVTNNIDSTLKTYNQLTALLNTFENYGNYFQVKSLLDSLKKLSVLALTDFNKAKYSFNFICNKISDLDLFTYLRDYADLTDNDIEYLFETRDDIQCIDTTITDLEVAQKITEVVNTPPGSTALSTKELNQEVSQQTNNAVLFDQTEAQLLNLDALLNTLIIQLNQASDFNAIQSKLQRVLKTATNVSSSLDVFNDTYNTPPDTETVKGYRSFDSPASLLYRTVNPAKTFNITKETQYVINASKIMNGDSSGTYTLLSSISTLIDTGLRNYSALNTKVQNAMRPWWSPLESSTSIISNLTGDGVYAKSIFKCGFSSNRNVNLNLNINTAFSALDDALSKSTVAINSALNILSVIINELLCRIKLLLDKIDLSKTVDNSVFHCEASLKIGLDPSIVTLISDIASKLSVILLLPQVGSINLRILSLNATNLPISVSGIITHMDDCSSEIITEQFGPEGQITLQATEALDAFGSVFSAPSPLKDVFSLPQPPENLAALLQTPTISTPKKPKI